MGTMTCSGYSRSSGWTKNKSFLLKRPLLLLALFVLVFCGAPGCKRHSGAATGAARSTPAGTPPAQIWKEFSADKAFAHVKAQCDLGPRPSGSARLEQARVLITAELERNGWQVERQTFIDTTPRGPVTFVNLIARFGGSNKSQQYLICSHYDTKIFDAIQFVGASDGASSTGALMELSRVLALDPALASRTELVFFDGEEAVIQYSQSNGVLTDGLYGSRHYAKDLAATGRAKQFQAGILWDMIGNSQLNITLSPDSPSALMQAILASADQLQQRKSFSIFDRTILDDHSPLNEVGIPSIDLIGFDYPFWHTADDTLDKLSPESLKIVGSVTLHWLKNAGNQPKEPPRKYVGQ